MRGFCVARSTTMGNARASKCGAGNRSDLHAFLYSYSKNLSLIAELGRSIGNNKCDL